MGSGSEHGAEERKLSKATKLVLVSAALVVLLGTCFVLWIVLETATLLGPRTLHPDDCRTALVETLSCLGEDRSFQECLYHFRAEGVPDPAMCRAFVLGNPKVTGSSDRCPPGDPSSWRPVECRDYALGSEYRCFLCVDNASHERNRSVLQAFRTSCDHAVVLAACNSPLRP
jgi:hypothetical protein